MGKDKRETMAFCEGLLWGMALFFGYVLLKHLLGG
jgi:hypothetical protein